MKYKKITCSICQNQWPPAYLVEEGEDSAPSDRVCPSCSMPADYLRAAIYGARKEGIIKEAVDWWALYDKYEDEFFNWPEKESE